MVVVIQLVWEVSLMAYRNFVDYGGTFVPQIKGAKGGGKGGGGRKDFAQAGGQDKSKIDEAFEKIKKLI